MIIDHFLLGVCYDKLVTNFDTHLTTVWKGKIVWTETETVAGILNEFLRLALMYHLQMHHFQSYMHRARLKGKPQAGWMLQANTGTSGKHDHE